MFWSWSEVRGVLALGRDARRRGPSSLSLLPAVLGRRVRLDRPGKCRRPLDLVVARPLAVADVAVVIMKIVDSIILRVEVDVFTATPTQEGDLESLKTRLREALGKEPVLQK